MPGRLNDGAARLDAIAIKIDAGSGDPLARRWVDAVVRSMEHKIELYAESRRLLDDEIVDQQLKLNELVRQARQPVEHVGDPRAVDPGRSHARPERSPPEDGALAQWAQTDKWDLVKDSGGHDRWLTLLAQKAAFKEIEATARSRRDQAVTTASRRSFAEAVRELAAYDTQPLLLTAMADLIEAFINAPLVAQNAYLNFILLGAPGVGKTRLAGALGKLLSRLGLFVYESVIECGRSDLIAEYIGQTAPKTRAFLLTHLEQIVFLDEAYSLTTWTERADGGRLLDAYSGEAVSEMVAFLSQYVGRSCLICAGYVRNMIEDFLPANDGLTRRFSYMVVMRAYETDHMVRIFLEALVKALSTPINSVSEQAVRDYFTIPAVALLEDVITDARAELNDEPLYPLLHELIAPQAGAMVDLANVTAILIASNPRGPESIGVRSASAQPSWAIGYLDMLDLLITQLQRRFPETSRSPPSDNDWHSAARELEQIGAENGWVKNGRWEPSRAAKERALSFATDSASESGASTAVLSDASERRYGMRPRRQ